MHVCRVLTFIVVHGNNSEEVNSAWQEEIISTFELRVRESLASGMHTPIVA